jgi:quinol monooxygenase YgiN
MEWPPNSYSNRTDSTHAGMTDDLQLIVWEIRMVTLIAKLTAKPEKTADLEKVLRSFVDPTRSEKGCLEYHLHRSVDQSNVFVFYEVWQDKETLDVHLAMPYLSKFWAERMDYLEKDAELVFLDMLSEIPVAA